MTWQIKEKRLWVLKQEKNLSSEETTINYHDKYHESRMINLNEGLTIFLGYKGRDLLINCCIL